MKKILFGLTTLFIASQLLVSCSSESEILSQFSKRKYLKKYKSKNIKHENVIEKRENQLAYEITSDDLASIETTDAAVVKESKIVETERLATPEVLETTESNLVLGNNYSQDYTLQKINTNRIDFSSKENKEILINNLQKSTSLKSSGANEIVIAILCIFIPPLAVFLYEDSITTNFWIDLVGTLLFWLPGIILAFLICFGGVSF